MDCLRQDYALSLLSGDEAVAMAAFDSGVRLGTGYPGTPSTEILETFESLGGRAQWSPNEKVALEVGIGVAFAGARALVTMKHVGLNVAADPLFTVAYIRLDGALVVVSADDPGMASSQNEQDNRRYALAAGVPMLEPSDSQEAYEFTVRAIEISERWQVPVLLRMTTRVCHSKTVVRRGTVAIPPSRTARFEHDLSSRVMIPAYARPAHLRLRKKLAEIAAWNDESGPNELIAGSTSLGIITSGVAFQYVREVAPEASVLKLGMTYPLPVERMRAFAAGVERCLVIEEGDPYLVEGARSAAIAVEGKPEAFRFGELNTARVRRILEGDNSPEPKRVPGKPPALCPGCPHRSVYTALKNLDCIVPGDIGCYSLGVLPPFEAMDSLVCMGAAIGVGLGLRHSLPPQDAKRVVSVIGDSTFVHSGITGLVEMVYNPPESGHVVLILDNGTTAMTGMQEHPGTGRTLAHAKTGKVVFEDVARALGVRNVHVIDPTLAPSKFQELIQSCLDRPELSVVIARRDCLLATRSIREYERCNEQPTDYSETRVTAPRNLNPQVDATIRERRPCTELTEASQLWFRSNVVIAGLGGQGVLKASGILADVAFSAGLDVKKSELHGMSQRGGSVSSDVRFGQRVFSPMTPEGEADFLVVIAPDQVPVNAAALRQGGVLIEPSQIDESILPSKKSINVALLGALSRYLPFSFEAWTAALQRNLPEKLHEANLMAFSIGRGNGKASERAVEQ